MTPLLEIEHLTTHFRRGTSLVKAVDGVSLRVDEGRTLAIVGESGSGKSVSMLSLLGLLPSTVQAAVSGSARLRGVDLLSLSEGDLRRQRGRDIGMIFQDPMTALNPYLRLETQLTEGVRLNANLSRAAARQLALAGLQAVGLPDPERLLRSFPHQLSGGMRQRVMIAMAMMPSPSLLIADEPTTALDVTVQAQILALLAKLKSERALSLIIITHDLGVVAGLADDVVVMYAGKIVESGPVNAIFAAPQHPYTQGLLRSIPSLVNAEERLVPLPGLPPDPAALPIGCAFAPRCAQALAVCKTAAALPNRQHQNHHKSSCHREVNGHAATN